MPKIEKKWEMQGEIGKKYQEKMFSPLSFLYFTDLL